MFNHYYGIAIVTQLLETIDESYVVALVQSDGWLVKYIEHIYKLRTNLGGESDTLTLPPLSDELLLLRDR